MSGRCIRTIVSLLLILSFSLSFAVADSVQPRADTHFQTYSVSMSTTDDGRLNVMISVSAVETSAILGVPTFDIQQKISGIWITVSDGNPGKIKTDTVTCTLSRNFGGVIEGEQYRVIADMYCEKYDGSIRALELTSQSYTLGT